MKELQDTRNRSRKFTFSQGVTCKTGRLPPLYTGGQELWAAWKGSGAGVLGCQVLM
jgi:hypothetical protein